MIAQIWPIWIDSLVSSQLACLSCGGTSVMKSSCSNSYRLSCVMSGLFLWILSAEMFKLFRPDHPSESGSRSAWAQGGSGPNQRESCPRGQGRTPYSGPYPPSSTCRQGELLVRARKHPTLAHSLCTQPQPATPCAQVDSPPTGRRYRRGNGRSLPRQRPWPARQCAPCFAAGGAGRAAGARGQTPHYVMIFIMS